MAYFKWFGYDQKGQPHTGHSACVDTHDLGLLLRQQGIECVHAAPVRHTFLKPCSFSDRQAVLNELSQLLQAHVRLSQALAIISSLVKKEYTRQVLLFCMRSVDQGKSFADAAAYYPELFDMLTLHALKAGHDSGFLATACTQRSAQLQEIAGVRAKIVSAVAMPLITALFFMVVIIFLIIFILPQFKKIFQMLKTPLPASTKLLLALGDWVTLFNIVALLGCVTAFAVVCFGISKSRAGKRGFDWLLLHMPVVGPLYQDLARAQCLQSISLLMKSGQTLSRALLHVGQSFNSSIIQQQLVMMQEEVQKGRPFALVVRLSPLFAVAEITNCVTIAHETAQLEIILQQLSVIFRARALKRLDRITLFMQPLLLVALGVAIGFLLLSLYLPLLQIPQAF